MTILMHVENESGEILSTDAKGNINLYAPFDFELYPYRMPLEINTKVKIKKINRYTLQAFGTELLARKYLVTIPSGISFPDFDKDIIIPLMNFGDSLVKIKKGVVIAQLRAQLIVDVNIKNKGE